MLLDKRASGRSTALDRVSRDYIILVTSIVVCSCNACRRPFVHKAAGSRTDGWTVACRALALMSVMTKDRACHCRICREPDLSRVSRSYHRINKLLGKSMKNAETRTRSTLVSPYVSTVSQRNQRIDIFASARCSSEIVLSSKSLTVFSLEENTTVRPGQSNSNNFNFTLR